MKKHSTLLISAVMLMAVLSTSLLFAGDIFLKQKHHTDSMKMMGQTQPARDEIHTIWMTQDKSRMDGPENSSIVRLDKNTIYLLDNKKKTYTELPLGKEKNIMQGMNQKDAATIQNLMKNMPKMTVTITPTGEKKKINSWNCTQYMQTMGTGMGQNKSEIWATEDIKVNMEVFSKMNAAMAAQNPGFGNAMEKMAAEMKKIKGVTVYTTSSMEMMGATVKSSTELMEIKEGTAPLGIFDIPAGYKKSAVDQF